MGFITGFMWALFIIVILVLLATILCLMTGLLALYEYANDILRDCGVNEEWFFKDEYSEYFKEVFEDWFD